MAGITPASGSSSMPEPSTSSDKTEKSKKQKKSKASTDGNIEESSGKKQSPASLAGEVEMIAAAADAKESKEERRARKKADKMATSPTTTLPKDATAAPPALPPRVAGEALAAPPATVMASESDSTTLVRKSKKKRSREKEDRPLEPPPDMVIRPAMTEISRQAEIPTTEVDEEDVRAPVEVNKEKKVKKRKREAEGMVGVEVAVTQGESEEPKKKVKKEKKSKRPLEASSASHIETPPPPAQPSSIGTDIFSDPALSDQAKRALQYAHLHATSHLASSPSKPGQAWKFNKARQGWLMRNIWNDVEIPEKYVELALGYLKTVQGSGRAGLIERANEVAASSQTVPVSADEADEEVSPAVGQGPKTTEEAGGEETGSEVKKERAEKLLKIMTT